MTFDELEHTRSQLYACRSHEADLQLELEQLQAEVRRLQAASADAAVLESVADLAEAMGWRLHHLVRRHHLDGDDPALWEATARSRTTPAEYEAAEGLSMGIALAVLRERLERRGDQT